MLTEQQQKEFEEYFEIFALPGWEHFKKYLANEYVLMKEHAHINCPTNDLWQEHRGRMLMLEAISNFENFVRLQYDEKQLEFDEDVDV